MIRKKIISVAHLLVAISHNIAALTLAVALILVFYQVVTRFIIGESATWTEILARGLIVWSTFISMAAAFYFGAMIPIEVILRILPGRLKLFTHRLVTLLILTFLGILIWNGYLMALRVVHQQIAMLDVSMSWFYAALPIGAVFAMFPVVARYFEIEKNFREDTMQNTDI